MTQKGSFIQNAFTFLSANVIGVALGFVFAPILSRIFPLEAYGTYSLYGSIISNISIIATFGFVSALVLPKNFDEAKHLVHICFKAILFTCLASLVLVLVFRNFSLGEYLYDQLSYWYYLIPAMVFLSSMQMLVKSLAVRTKSFRTLSIGGVIYNLSSRLLSLGVGVLSGGWVFGILVGDFFTRPVEIIIVGWKNFKGYLFKKQQYELTDSQLIKKYIRFPLFSMPGSYLQNLIVQIPIWYVGGAFGSKVLGLFSWSVTLLNIPTNVLAQSIAKVFLQKLTDVGEDEEKLKEVTWRLFKGLAVVGVLPYTILFVLGDVIFAVFLGEKYREAGTYASVMAIAFYLQMLAFPLMQVFRIKGKEKLMFVVNSLHVLLLLSSCIILQVYQPLHLLIGVTLVNSFLFSFVVFRALHAIGVSVSSLLKFSIVFLIVLSVLYSLRFLLL